MDLGLILLMPLIIASTAVAIMLGIAYFLGAFNSSPEKDQGA